MPSSSLSVHTVISHCKTLLEIASGVPVPALKSAFQMTAKILEEFEKLQSLKESCLILVERTVILLCALHLTLQNQPEDFSKNTNVNINNFLRELETTKSLMESYAGMSWFRRFFKRFTIQKDMEFHKSRLETSFDVFQIKLTLDLNDLLVRASQSTEATHRAVLATDHRIASLQEKLSEAPLDACVFRHGEVIAIRTRHTFRQNRFPHGKINHCKLVKDGSSVIRKMYRANDAAAMVEYEREKRVLKGISGPEFIQFLGQSVPGCEAPFILLQGCQDVNLRDVLQRRLSSTDVCTSFLAAVEIVEGVASALRHLALEFKLGTWEWDECMKVSNLLVDPTGHPILGRNLVENTPAEISPNKLDCEQQLNRILLDFYYLVDEMLFGDTTLCPPETWSAVGERRPLAHLRPLMTLIAWRPSITYQDIVEHISSFSHRISAVHNISWPNLREELLATDGLYHAFPFQRAAGEKVWNVKLFDIGYVHGEDFVRVCNAMDKYKPCIAITKDAEISTVPLIPETDITLFPGGIRQYKFRDTYNASMMRQLDNEKLTDTVLATRMLRDESKSILEIARQTHDIRVSDLVLVTTISNYPAGASIIFNDKNVNPPKEFYFYCHPAPEWGYWSLCDTPSGKEEIPWTSSNSGVSWRQYIEFIQLQEEDCDEIITSGARSYYEKDR